MAPRNLRLAAELIHILNCLERAGITAIPYKGPVLAELLYGDLARRDFSDLDVLVAAKDLGGAKTALASIGFEPHFELAGARQQAFVRDGYECTYDGPAGRNLLELQWQLAPRFFAVDFDMTAIFARAQTVSMAGRSVCTLAAEDLLPAVCVHAAKHLWGRLGWLRDIAALAEHGGFVWEQVLGEAERLGIARIVAVSLLLARNLLDATLPDAATEFANQDPASRQLAAQVAAHIPVAQEFSTESLAYFGWMLRLRERFSDRRRFLTRLAFTPSLGEWAWVPLPDGLFPLYRVVRMARLSTRLLGLR
jgi:hypothetical protein